MHKSASNVVFAFLDTARMVSSDGKFRECLFPKSGCTFLTNGCSSRVYRPSDAATGKQLLGFSIEKSKVDTIASQVRIGCSIIEQGGTCRPITWTQTATWQIRGIDSRHAALGTSGGYPRNKKITEELWSEKKTEGGPAVHFYVRAPACAREMHSIYVRALELGDPRPHPRHRPRICRLSNPHGINLSLI